jgi:hypothetical protein
MADTETTVPETTEKVRRRRAPVGATTTTVERAPELTPRGTERVRRRAQQAEHRAQADVEAAALTSPSTPAKEAAIEANKQLTLARFGPTKKTRRETLQRENRDRVETEAEQIAEVSVVRRNEIALPAAGQQSSATS